MFIAPDKNFLRRRGFTLLEITFAVAILAMMSMAIYRFVESNLLSMRISAESTLIDSKYDGLRELLTMQWQSLPAGEGNLTGEPFKFSGRSRDEVTWNAGAGPGVLTRYAQGITRHAAHATLERQKANGHRRDAKTTNGRSGRKRNVVPAFAKCPEHANTLLRSAPKQLGRSLDRHGHAAATR